MPQVLGGKRVAEFVQEKMLAVRALGTPVPVLGNALAAI
jgi:hypothetical protein